MREVLAFLDGFGYENGGEPSSHEKTVPSQMLTGFESIEWPCVSVTIDKVDAGEVRIYVLAFVPRPVQDSTSYPSDPKRRSGSRDSDEPAFYLVHERGSVPNRHLRWLTEIIEVRSDPGECSDTKRLLFDLYRSANWELQNRYRTM